jgi:hypothetical protein
MINWKQVITELAVKEGTAITTDPAHWNLENPHYLEIYNKWKAANFNLAAIKWINYYPNKDYDQSIVDQVADNLKLKGVHRSWISRIDPGYMAPWHWDVDDNEDEYSKQGITRYTVFIKDFSPGEIFIINDNFFIKAVEGESVQWKSHRDWHSGINGSMEINWMFHILGY